MFITWLQKLPTFAVLYPHLSLTLPDGMQVYRTSLNAETSSKEELLLRSFF